MFFPRYCLECRKQGKYICLDCLSKVHKASFVCPFCKSFSYSGVTHPSCQSKTILSGAVAIWKYEGVIRKAILALKYKFASDIALEIVSLIELNLDKNHLETGTVVPVPLYQDRLRWRGFNQAYILGEAFAKNMNLEFGNALIRKVNTPPQARLHKSERLRNMRGVFAVNKQFEPNIKGQKVILFDDVWTTGATLEEAARELKQNGALEVWGLSIAR